MEASLHIIEDEAVVYSPEELKKFYHDMVLVRRFEEKAGQLYGMGLIAGFCHLYNGQEAVVAGMYSVQEPQDTVITTYREHGQILVAGTDPKVVMAELTGRATGCAEGKGGSMHLFDRDRHFYGGHGIVGASSSIGTGLAFSHKYKGENAVCITYMGDGAANQGQVFESYNMAALWNLPALYIIENNQYAMGTSTARHCAGDLYKRGEPFGIPGEQVDGMDLFAVQEAGKRALEYVRSGKGPYILEMMTYRFKGHSMSDPGKYRSKEELSEYKDERDPIVNLKTFILDDGRVSEAELKEIEKSIKERVNEAAAFAQESPLPDEDELWTDVLVDNK